MYRENYIDSLRTELLEMVQDYLSPVALRYGYSDVPLETNIKWRPLVLILGNYSSGKSTLINELLGATIQDTGQAPTDDSFTVITHDGGTHESGGIGVIEERDGKYLLSDPDFPFDALKKHGQRFTSHFCLKKINSPFLENLALIDTPGMLDSITERDRGYNYQDVIGDLAQIADLILILFDPHKAGTIREAHTSLRDTLPARTFEDRILFVLNRIDECSSLTDLLQVYGTLCWNLSQMTGRKDIPTIHLTYSPNAAKNPGSSSRNADFLSFLDNKRDELKEAILQAPRHRLDHLATFVETHGERLLHFLEALIGYRKKIRRASIKNWVAAVLTCLAAGAGISYAVMALGLLPMGIVVYLLAGAISLTSLLLWKIICRRYFSPKFHSKCLGDIDSLTELETQTRRDSWHSTRELVVTFLKKNQGRYSLRDVKKDYNSVQMVCDRGSKEIREALNELASLRQGSFEEPEERFREAEA